MEILAIIPARGGSKRVPQKNIKTLCKKPLIHYTIEAAKNASLINRVIVSTDSEDIAAIAKEVGADVPFLRPHYLCTDASSTIDAVRWTIKELKKREGYNADIICILQATSPLRNSTHIDEALQMMIKEEAEALISVKKVREHPYWMVQIQEGRIKKFIKNPFKYQSQTLPPLYIPNGAIYILRKERVWRKEPFKDALAYIMEEIYSIDIDEEIDFLFAETILKKLSG